MMRRARNPIFWLGIVKEILQMADNCHICQAQLYETGRVVALPGSNDLGKHYDLGKEVLYIYQFEVFCESE